MPMPPPCRRPSGQEWRRKEEAVQQLEAASSSTSEVTPQVPRLRWQQPARCCRRSPSVCSAWAATLPDEACALACLSARPQSWSMTLRGANERLVPLGHDLTSGLYLSQRDPYKAGRWVGLAGAVARNHARWLSCPGRVGSSSEQPAPATAQCSAAAASPSTDPPPARRQLEVVGRPSAGSLSTAAAGLGSSLSPRSASNSSVGALRNGCGSSPSSVGATPMATHRWAFE